MITTNYNHVDKLISVAESIERKPSCFKNRLYSNLLQEISIKGECHDFAINPPDFDYIASNICSFFKILEKDVFARTRKRDVLKARQLIQAFAVFNTSLSLSQIAAYSGGMSHSTILHSKNATRNFYETETAYRAKVDKISSMFNLKFSRYE